VMYLDAAVDSPLDLSVLYFRGQDRLAVPLAMLSALLVVPGLQAWARLLRRSPSLRAPHRRRSAAVALIALAALAALSSIPAPLLRRSPPLRAPHRRRRAAVALTAPAVIAAPSSIPTRLDAAAKNPAEDYPGRGRFLQSDELAQFARVAPQLADGTTILASPY